MAYHHKSSCTKSRYTQKHENGFYFPQPYLGRSVSAVLVFDMAKDEGQRTYSGDTKCI